MRVIPVPDGLREAEWVDGTRVYGSPSGDLTDPVVPPAEAVLFHTHPAGAPEGVVWPCVGVVLALEDADVEAIANGARLLLMGWPGQAMPVFLVPEVLDTLTPTEL